MKIESGYFLRVSLLIWVITALIGCTKDQGLGKAPDAPTSVTLNLMLPSPTTLQSYGIDEDRENEVIRLDVFIFNEAGNILNNVGHQTIRSFSQSGTAITALVAIDRSVAKQRFYIIANGTDAMFSSGITTKAQLDALDIGSAKMPQQLFVMSAQSELLTVTSADFANKFTFSLIRCVARMDVKVDKTKVTNFKIKSAKVVNARSRSYLYQKKDAGGMVTMPATSTMLSYERQNMILSEEYGFTAKLYAYENYNAKAAEIDNTTSIILGGEYGNSGVTTYYLIDVRDSDKKLQLLRNNRYDITINQVDGPGFNDEDDAQTGANANLHYTIEVWKQSNVDAEFDGTIYLGVSERQIQISREAFGSTIVVETNADSYAITSPIDASDRPATWLSVNTEAMTINYSAATNYTGAARTAYFYVKAGSKLKIKVSVTQTYGDLSIIKLSATSVSAPIMGTGAAPALTIITSGRDNVTWTINPAITKFGDMSDWVRFVGGQPMTGTGRQGQQWEVKVNADAMSLTTPSRSAIVQIDAKDNASGVVEHYKFTVVQLSNTDIVITPDRFYMAAMGDRTTIALPVTSNATWTATFFNGNGHAATVQPSMDMPGVNFKFAKDVTGTTFYPHAVTDGKSWHTYTATGNDVLYICFINDLRNTNKVIDGYLELRNGANADAVVCRVRLHHGDYQNVEVNGMNILDRNMGSIYPGALNRSEAHAPAQIANACGYRYQFGRIPDGYETVISYGTINATFTGKISALLPNGIPVYNSAVTTEFLSQWSYIIAGNNSWMAVNGDTPSEQRTPGNFWDANANVTTSAMDIANTNETGVRTIYDPCPDGYRVPTAKELKHIFLSTKDDNPAYNPISGFIGIQFGRWILESKAGAPRDVFFPAAGASVHFDHIGYRGPKSTEVIGSNNSYATEGYYMSSSPAGTPDRFHYLFFDNTTVEMRNSRHPSLGVSYVTGALSVRCVRNN